MAEPVQPHSIEHLWTLLCRGVVKDERGISLIGLIDMVHVPVLPPTGILEHPCCVLSYWRRNGDPATIRQRIAFECREGERAGQRWILPGEDEIVLTTRHLFCAIKQFDQLPIGGHGQHMFVVQRQDDPAGDWIDAPPTAGLWIASDEMVKGITPSPRLRSPGVALDAVDRHLIGQPSANVGTSSSETTTTHPVVSLATPSTAKKSM